MIETLMIVVAGALVASVVFALAMAWADWHQEHSIKQFFARRDAEWRERMDNESDPH
jgi:hypothetical protein